MTIFVDKLGHLVTDKKDQTELHEFAGKIGMKRQWFQDINPAHPHYDLTTNRAINRAIRAGAVIIDPKVVVSKLKAVHDRE